jgi:ankyrin repeat protein
MVPYKSWLELQKEKYRGLVRACVKGNLKEVARWSQKGVHASAYQKGLEEACMHGRLDVAIFLIEAGADVNDSSCGEPLLHVALRGRNTEVARYLLSLGGDPNSHGRLHPATPIEIAIMNRLGFMAVELMRYGAELPDLGAGEVSSEVQLAIARFNDVSEDLCQKPGWYVGKMLNDLPLLHAVSAWGAVPWLKRAVLSGADINSRCGMWQSNTPLHLACSCGKEDAIAFLLASGANEDAKNRDGHMPFQCAIELGQVPAMVAYLKAKGLAPYQQFRGRYLNEWFAHDRDSMQMCNQVMQAALSSEAEVQLQQAFGAFDSSITAPQVSAVRRALIL